ncbi:sugar-binding domain-containing protein [Maribacter polysaccharolyticus]|uniref:sugar-binding domain-containing protein n=1 Tax=Maribacter polysaccharolyticus TaxID=3020831 RepID=UPI00237F50FA|nr:sugar-binding domain-containing protein [Maribacter polysaccharolyticus]MDE3740980.1 glycoside hydrolase family 2 TIM barrel-domain containing protein [Maribacter polysaccharolyticus]
MKCNSLVPFIFFILLCPNYGFSQRETIELNTNWKFVEKDNPNFSNPKTNTSNWNDVQIPHDWAFEKGISKDGAQGASGGYFDGGIGWYQRTFKASKKWSDKRVIIDFDGVYMNSEVWVNGHYLGKRPYGYISFRYDLSKYLLPGNNTIAVRVDNSKEPSARWYHPCGIYAPVRLIITDKKFIPPHGVYVTTPTITADFATVNIETSLQNSSTSKSKGILETSILDANGNLISKNSRKFVSKGSNLQLTTRLNIENPKLWSPDNPYLYMVISRLKEKGKLIDEVKTRIGVRSIAWKTDTGFWLNGKATKLLGVSEHYEGGPLGGAWTKPMLRWKLGLLKDMGVNAIRTAHNPAPPIFYELCDEMGILVMDEIFDGWSKKAKEDYGKQAFDGWWKKDMTEWLLRNRNHPSIVIYSVGNETKGDIAKELVALCHDLDPEKPVTSGHSSSEYMDVYGVNGGSEKQGFFNKPLPNKPFVSTEAPHTWQTRGYYRTKTWFRDGYPNKGQQPFELPDLAAKEVFHYEWAPVSKWKNGKQHFNSSYDNAMVRISARKNWELMRDLPWFSGHFRWTGFDYYGEAGYVHGGWPFRLFMGGALDVAGFKKDLFYFYQSQWTEEPMAHILPHWTHPTLEKGVEIPVWVYSNGDEVELFLNGRSLGKDKPGTQWNDMQCEWMVPWEPGKLIAKAYKNGEVVAVSKQVTAAKPSGIQLKPENDHIDIPHDKVAIVTAYLVDDKGVYYPYGENKIHYHLKGNAVLLSLENGDPVDTTKNVGVSSKKAFMGATRAFLKWSGSDKNIALTAGAIVGEKQLLTSKKVSIDVKTLYVTGTKKEASFTVYYTIDGTIPTTKSRIYKTPFEIDSGTTVKAIVVDNGQVILNMEEKFDEELGLSFNDVKTQKTAKINTNGMLAADADIEGAKVVSIDGKHFLDFKSGEGSVVWYQENDGSAGTFSLRFTYASNDLTARPMELVINNERVGIIDFKSSGAWNVQWKEVKVKALLQAGANYIELKTIGKSGPHLFMLNVE